MTPRALGILMLLAVALLGVCDSLQVANDELVFVYVHGFGESGDPTPFEKNMRAFLDVYPPGARVMTYRWSRIHIDPAKVVSQWNDAKALADQKAKDFMEDLVMEFEAEKTRYVLVGYSLGCRVIAESLKCAPARLEHLRGVYFLGPALPQTYAPNRTRLPDAMKIVNYYSPHLDYVLKLCFTNAEGIKAGGETGFTDTAGFQNRRTVCTHAHKGGPIPRDYSNLAPSIAYLALFQEEIFLEGDAPRSNLETRVGKGVLHWNDIALFEMARLPILIQQNANTGHYRAVALHDSGKRVRKAWGTNLHTILRQTGLFPPPYARTIRPRKDQDSP